MAIHYVRVADDAFAMRPNVMKLYAQRGLPMVHRVFNYRLSRARRIIENVFGIMSARFRVQRQSIHLDAEKTKKITLLAVCYFCMTTNKASYTPESSFDQYDCNEIMTSAVEWRSGQTNSTLYPLQPPVQWKFKGNSRRIHKLFY